ncbi:hypothetical protein EOA32_00970 [Mesorhizobium sp. M1A.F.Ca.ET.072.01.1.1]|uniref:phage tail protein n=1 Tax=Mesorhizobium sp. M1A.F.Ca.ET.072.01.1.1 TaxID=2496753 RepID=UPI000FD41C20|nr:phage tail protein [Mesorhizobium sp. M1A.F.Ca.ET.072.01.1.1]RUW55621.1 hypothetical protein EOA32_00970 [Mesorhizobium sp. M1A.F.Ca.ET.072.01.1.1]
MKMRRLFRLAFETFSWLLCFVGVAHAGPLFAGIASVFSFIAGGSFVGNLIGIAITTALKIGIGLLTRGKNSKQQSGIKTDIQTGGDNPLSFIVGAYATAGQLEYVNTYGNDGDTPNAFITFVVSLSDIPVSGFTNTIWVNGEKCTISGDVDPSGRGNGVTEFLKDGKYYMFVKFYDGTQTVADAHCRAKFGSDPDRPFTADMIGRGVAYAVVTCRFNRKFFTGIPQMRFEVNGVKLYNPAKDSTNGGSGLHRWNDPTTWEFSKNNAVVNYNITRGIYYDGTWIFGGQNLPALLLPSASWIAAINECDAAISLVAGGTEPQYTCGYEVNVDQQPLDIIEAFLDGCSGRMYEIGGYYKITAGAPAAAVYSFTDGDILATEDLTFDPFPGLEQTYNGAHASYPEPGEGWAAKDAPPYLVPDLEAADEGRRLLANLQFATTTSNTQVQRLLKAAVEANRKFRRHIIPLPPEAWLLEPGDVVSWSSTREGYTTKDFLISAITGKVGMVQIVSVQEIDAADYDWTPGTDEKPFSVGYVGNVNPPVQTFTGFAASPATLFDNDGTPRAPSIAVNYPGTMDDVQSVRIQVKIATAPDTDLTFDGTLPYGDPGTNDDPLTAIINATFVPKTDYKVRGKLVPYSGRETDWSDWLDVTTTDVAISDARNDLAHAQADLIAFYTQLSAELQATRDRLSQLALAVAQTGGRIAKDNYAAVKLGNAFAAASTELFASIDEIDGQLVAQAGAITDVQASVGLVSADGLFQLVVSAGAGDVVSRLTAQVRATTGDAWVDAGLIMEAGFTGGNPALPFSNYIIKASNFYVTDGTNTHQPMVYSGGVLKLNIADVNIVNAGLIQGPTSGLKIDIDNEFISISVP